MGRWGKGGSSQQKTGAAQAHERAKKRRRDGAPAAGGRGGGCVNSRGGAPQVKAAAAGQGPSSTRRQAPAAALKDTERQRKTSRLGQVDGSVGWMGGAQHAGEGGVGWRGAQGNERVGASLEGARARVRFIGPQTGGGWAAIRVKRPSAEISFGRAWDIVTLGRQLRPGRGARPRPAEAGRPQQGRVCGCGCRCTHALVAGASGEARQRAQLAHAKVAQQLRLLDQQAAAGGEGSTTGSRAQQRVGRRRH